MYSKITKIINPTGLHARPACEFVQLAKSFDSKIDILNLDVDSAEPVSAKSIIRILSQRFTQGINVEITATGSDEVAAIDALVTLLESGFGE